MLLCRRRQRKVVDAPVREQLEQDGRPARALNGDLQPSVRSHADRFRESKCSISSTSRRTRADVCSSPSTSVL